jgi:hypothetical protein
MGEEEAMLHKGGCACKLVRYEIAAEPVRMFNCHCRDCQQATGSAYAPLLVFPPDKVRVKGDLRYFAVTSERGSKVERGFCPNCGNPVLAKIDDRPDKLFVFAASLDDPSLHRPQANVWMRSATPWDHVNPNVSAFEIR